MGRPIKDIQCRKITLYLDEITIEYAREIGDGNISQGIRRLKRISEKALEFSFREIK